MMKEMNTGMLNATTIENFKGSLRGELILRSDPLYEEARKLYNGMIDKRPLLIARCGDVADVISAVRFAREMDLLTAIRGGGHNGPGLGSCDDGLVIDLSQMKGVRVDPVNRTVRAEAGCTQGWGRSRGALIRLGSTRRHCLHHRHRRPHARWRPRLSHP